MNAINIAGRIGEILNSSEFWTKLVALFVVVASLLFPEYRDRITDLSDYLLGLILLLVGPQAVIRAVQVWQEGVNFRYMNQLRSQNAEGAVLEAIPGEVNSTVDITIEGVDPDEMAEMMTWWRGYNPPSAPGFGA